MSASGAPARVWMEGGEGGPFLPLTDRGFLHGEGVFETFLVRGTRPFRLAMHLERMGASATALGLPLPEGDWRSRVAAAVTALARSWGGEPGMGLLRARLTLTAGDVPPDGDAAGPWPAAPRLILALSSYLPPLLDPGTGWTALPEGPPVEGGEGSLLRHKTLSRLGHQLCLRAARARGAEEGLLATRDGMVLCGSRSNLFVITGCGDLVTPPTAAGCLPGVTRRIVLEEIAPQLGLATREDLLTPQVMAEAREAFLTNSLWGVAPLSRLADRPFSRPQASAITSRIYETYGVVLATDRG